MEFRAESFDDIVLPHLDAGYRLARWLLRNEHDAEDVVQEASLRAFRYFRTFSGQNGRAWFLTIVRNTCCSWYGQQTKAQTDPFDEEQHTGSQLTADPETLLLYAADASLIENTLNSLPPRWREFLVLRELEGLSYQELADVLEIPIGTVMSGLSRARQAFRRALELHLDGVDPHGSRVAGTVRVRTCDGVQRQGLGANDRSPGVAVATSVIDSNASPACS